MKTVNTTLPWVEKYRPIVLDDVVGNEEAIARMKVIARDGNLPHILLSGPPGTGKTTAIHCLARAMLTHDGDQELDKEKANSVLKEAVLELNASDERGIDVVRSNIKAFAQKKVTLPPGKHKLVILDEADNMTKSAQQALRRTMELYSTTTRFALACNYSTDIIEPIQSRCAIIRFTKLSDEQVLLRIRLIADAEKVAYTDKGLEALLFVSEGDMRQAINTLQASMTGFGELSEETVFKVVDQPHPELIQTSLKSVLSGDLDTALLPLIQLHYQGYPPTDIISSYFKIVKSYDFPENLKLDFIKELGMTQSILSSERTDTLTQVVGAIARLVLIVLAH